jgi:hypothetical protein
MLAGGVHLVRYMASIRHQQGDGAAQSTTMNRREDGGPQPLLASLEQSTSPEKYRAIRHPPLK